MTDDDILSLMTPELVVAFQRGDYLEVHRLLRLAPWEVSPLDATGPCPAWERRGSWSAAVRVRRAIVKILKDGRIMDNE